MKNKKFNRCKECKKYFPNKGLVDETLCYKHRNITCKREGCVQLIPEDRKKPGVKTCSDECQIKIRRVYDMNTQRKKIGSGNSIDEVGEIFFGNVKEPLMPVPKGNFGYLGVISYNKTKDKIQCHICGRFFRSLSGSGHLKIHGIDNAEYKEKFSLDRTMALVAESTREKHLKALTDREDYQAIQKKLKEYRESDEIKKGNKNHNLGKKRRIGAKNKTGTCPLQLLDRIKVLHEKLNYIPNSEDFKREYGGKFIGSIVQMYGSYNKALEYMGITPRDRFEELYSDEELLKFLRDFYTRFDRTPSNTDFKRGYLPHASTYIRRFRTLNRARVFANVPLMINYGGWKWKEIPITDELKKQFA